jgi:hypothetical protein
MVREVANPLGMDSDEKVLLLERMANLSPDVSNVEKKDTLLATAHLVAVNPEPHRATEEPRLLCSRQVHLQIWETI